MILVADDRKLFCPLGSPSIRYRASLYVDDVIIFISSEPQDIRLIIAILQCFEQAAGLATNLNKCTLTPIHCGDAELQLVQQLFPC